MKNNIKLSIGIALWAVALLLSLAARMLQDFAQWYSVRIYPIWVGSIGRLAGYLPFSVSELLLCLLVLGIPVCVYRTVTRAVRIGNRDWGKWAYAWFLNLFLLTAILCFLYVVNCGINYHRTSFSDCTGIRTEEYSAEELKEVCLWLTGEIAACSKEVERDRKGGMVVSGQAGENAADAMERLGRDYPELAGYYPQPKKLVNSWILSVQSLTGIYSPFTIEANYNGDMQAYNIPFTACHELSHLRGFMQEQEANFIAFLACGRLGDPAFAYSGNLYGWIECMNVLYRTDNAAWKEVRSRLPADAEADLEGNRAFWAKYDGKIAEVSNRINDTYLKANGQKDGVKSYNRMVDLIVAYYNKIIM